MQFVNVEEQSLGDEVVLAKDTTLPLLTEVLHKLRATTMSEEVKGEAM